MGSGRSVVGQFEIATAIELQSRYIGVMAAKDRYSIGLKCKSCGNAGTAHISENDHAYAPPEAAVENIEGNFTLAANPKRNVMSMSFRCGQCGTVSDD